MHGAYNSAGCLLVGIGSEMASSGLGLEEQEICPSSRREEHFSTHILAPNKDNYWH
jgi:hypothetical protein